MKRKREILGVPIVLFIIGILTIGGASAALVNYLSNTVYTAIVVESPLTINETVGLDLIISYSGDDDFALVKITNNAERDIVADAELTLSPDTVGISTAITEDINYCFSGQGDMSGVTDCEADYMVWMANNVAWNDWYANEEYNDSVFFSDLVIDYEGDSFHSLGGYTGNKLILPGLLFPAGETVYGVVYVATNQALEPTTYEFDMTIVPTV